MSSITAEPEVAPAGEPVKRTQTSPLYYARKALKAVASLQLTVVLFSLGILLIFFGTLAQIDFGIWTVVDKYFWSWVVWVPFDLFHKFGQVFWKEQFTAGESWSGSFPFPAGKLIGGAMLLNLLAAHALRFRISWKRSGILLIHSGLILLFLGEFITREYAIEQRMTIEEGKAVNFTEDTRNIELAFIDKSAADTDRVTVIPQRILRDAAESKKRITHPDLSVDVEVDQYMMNSAMERAMPNRHNPATAGLGKEWIATAKPEVSGVDPNQKIDLPAAYVTLFEKGTDKKIGTYLVALRLYLRGDEEEVDLGGKKHELTMRFKRHYKPYSVHLDDFRFDRYMGTSKPKNSSSEVRVFDKDGTLIREQKIAMNEPMRLQGETFYQSSFDEATETTTILSVVKNPGWLIPYISCVVVTLGLLLHFSIYLIQFLTRRPGAPATTSAAATATPALTPGTPLSSAVRYFPWIMLGIVVLYLLSVFGRINPERQPYDLASFGQLPVVDGGRVKPIDTVARVNLRMISGREEFEDEKGNKQPAIKWYLEVISTGDPRRPGPAWKYKVFRIDNEQVLHELGLKPVEGLRYSLEEIGPNLHKIITRAAAVQQKMARGEKLDTTESKIKELFDRLNKFEELSGVSDPTREVALLVPPQVGEEKWQRLDAVRRAAQLKATVAAMKAAQKKITGDDRLANLTQDQEKKIVEELYAGKLTVSYEQLEPKSRTEFVENAVKDLKLDPEKVPLMRREAWLRAAFVVMNKAEQAEIAEVLTKSFDDELAANPAAQSWDRILAAYRDKKTAEFNKLVTEYRDTPKPTVPEEDLSRARTEVSYNRFAPFYHCTGLYVLVFVLSVLGFMQHAAQRPHWGEALRKAATYVLSLTLAVHTLALLTRMYLMERPGVFVTNLYSSAIFIGLGCVVLGWVLERIYPIGIGNVLASILGLATTIVAHNLANDDTLEMMQAVLDTNFWLATHVTTVTLGYTATFVAGFLGVFYVLTMLGTVIRDSFLSKEEPTVGSLLAFGVAVAGAVTIPILYLWFATTALVKFEVLHSAVLWGIFVIAAAAGVMYAAGLILLRISTEGTDARGKPLAGQIPNLAKPVVALALTPERGKILGQMIYGVLCFATLLSFVGTVLGGIWADQSWGRFWGWDPKENGAVLIVLWNSLILHARWAGLVKDRGVAVLAIFGNVITAGSWFGTNQLGIGLHAYGFDTRLADGCFNFWMSQLIILGLGLIPQQYWTSASRRALFGFAPATAYPEHSPNGSPVGTVPPPGASPNGTPNAQTNGQPKPEQHGQQPRGGK